MTLLPSGATRIDLTCSEGGVAGRIVRVVTPRIDVEGLATGSSLDLGIRVVVVDHLVPLFVAATLSGDGPGVLATLFLGPVRLDAGRTWGDRARRWGRLELSVRPWLAMAVGVEGFARARPFAHFRLFPAAHGLWDVAIHLDGTGPSLSIGGVLW